MSLSRRPLRFKQCSGINCTLFTHIRESEAQTDPFTPEFIEDRTKGIPEVLTIKDLVYGRGLPASMAEMELID